MRPLFVIVYASAPLKGLLDRWRRFCTLDMAVRAKKLVEGKIAPRIDWATTR